MLRYMLDTDICIYAMKHRPAELAEKLDEVSAEIAISTIVLGELLYGAEKSARRSINLQAVEAFAGQLELLAFDARAASHYGQIRAELARAGQVIGSFDMLIGGHARSEGLILVTNNERELTRIAGLRIENWSRPGA